VEQVGRLNQEYAAKRQAHREAMREERKQQREALRSILTPEQAARWEEIRQERRSRGNFCSGERRDSKPHRPCNCPRQAHRGAPAPECR
jgi:hypothetical protein